MKPIFIISHNTKSAGTLNITKNLIQFLSTQQSEIIITLPYNADYSIKTDGNIKIVRCHNRDSIIGFVNRIFFDSFVLPYLIITNRPKLIIGIANYFINYFGIPSKIIVRHPYLLEDKNLQFLNFKERIIEFLRKIYFNLTLKNTSHVFLQSKYMHELFIHKYPQHKEICSVLPNPISPYLEGISIEKIKSDGLLFIYPSRYYPHKNHQFIIKLAQEYKQYFVTHKIKFLITIDKNQNSSRFILNNIEKLNLSNIIVNLGERSQQELFKTYEKCFGMIFPSQAETFGNGLVEGLCINLPIIAPNLPYAQTIMEDAGIYYENNDINSAFNVLKNLVEDPEFYNDIVEKTKKQSKYFPTIENWWQKLTKSNNQ